MRDIAGQINDFSFADLAQGGLEFGAGFERLFLSAWTEQLRGAARGVQPGPVAALFSAIQRAVPTAANVDGNEHLGVTYTTNGTLPVLEDPMPMPAGAALAFSFSVDTIVALLDLVWQLMIGPHPDPGFGRIALSGPNAGLNDPQSPVEVNRITILSTDDHRTWITELRGVYHLPLSLPNVPFVFTNRESIDTFTDPNSPAFTYSASSGVDMDIASAKNAVMAAAVLGIGAPLAPLAASLEVPLSAFGASTFEDAVRSKLGLLRLFTVTPLSMVVAAFPTRFLIPDSRDKVVLPFDVISVPSTVVPGSADRVVAAMSDDFHLVPIIPNSAITAYGFAPPQRITRSSRVAIFGSHTVLFPFASLHPVTYANQITATFTAVANSEVQNPSFLWSIVDAAGRPTQRALLSANSGDTVSVTFLRDNVDESNPLAVVIHVTMDDDLNLQDDEGRTPAAAIHVAAKLAPRPVIPPIRRPIREHLG
jgi:hypothetical protein